MSIRKAKKEDLKEIAEIMREEFSKEPYNEDESFENIMKSLKFYFKSGEIYVTSKEKITGVIVYKKEVYWEGPVFIIEDLAIKEKFKRKEIDKSLMNFVKDKAQKEGIKSIYFSTHKDTKAIDFYKKLGYKIDKKIISMYKKLK